MSASSEEKTKNVRELASEILRKVETKNAYADLLLDHALRNTSLPERDRALLTELTYGTLRWRAAIDARLESHLRQPLGQTDPFLRNLLRVTVYQLLFLDKVPSYAAVNEAVNIAKARAGSGKSGFVNGVLRNLLRAGTNSPAADNRNDSAAGAAISLSHPQWLVERWFEQFGAEDARALMRANNERAPLVLRVNLRRATRDEILERLRNTGIGAEPTRRSPQGIVLATGVNLDKLADLQRGLLQVQSEASQLVSYILAPRPGERILDACAAPGGKATHIAEILSGAGEVIACDKSEKGIERIRQNAARLGLDSIQAIRADLTRDLAAPYRAPYDRVLLDAPCTGFGTLRSHPEIKWQRTPADIDRLSRLQAVLLGRVAPLVKPGGILVYSTCTLMPAENEQQVERFLSINKDFELENASAFLPAEAKLMAHGVYFMALPHRDNTDGFFAARMRRKES